MMLCACTATAVHNQVAGDNMTAWQCLSPSDADRACLFLLQGSVTGHGRNIWNTCRRSSWSVLAECPNTWDLLLTMMGLDRTRKSW